MNPELREKKLALVMKRLTEGYRVRQACLEAALKESTLYTWLDEDDDLKQRFYFAKYTKMRAALRARSKLVGRGDIRAIEDTIADAMAQDPEPELQPNEALREFIRELL